MTPEERDAIYVSSVKRFSERMLEKLRKNDHKGCWRDGASTTESLIFRTHQELVELHMGMLCHDTPFDVFEEAVDVANMAMMAADVYGIIHPLGRSAL